MNIHEFDSKEKDTFSYYLQNYKCDPLRCSDKMMHLLISLEDRSRKNSHKNFANRLKMCVCNTCSASTRGKNDEMMRAQGRGVFMEKLNYQEIVKKSLERIHAFSVFPCFEVCFHSV